MNPKDTVGAKKAPLKLVPPALVIGAAEAMQTGAAKYGPYNWRDQPIEVMTYIEAAERHLHAFKDGQNDAEDTGVHHLKHVVAGLGIVLDAMAIPGGLIDNRPKAGPAADLLREQDKTVVPQKPAVPQRVEQAPITAIRQNCCGCNGKRCHRSPHSPKCRDFLEAAGAAAATTHMTVTCSSCGATLGAQGHLIGCRFFG